MSEHKAVSGHEKIETSLAGATDEQRRRILWANAAELYGVEAPVSRA